MIRNKLSAIMGAKRIKIYELQKMSGISRSTITRLYYEKTNMINLNTLEALCKALECSLNDLFEIT